MNRSAAYPDVLELIPQRPPMVMIHRLVDTGTNYATTELKVEVQNIFVEKGLFSDLGVIENIAQTAAALNGYQALRDGNQVKNGYIGGIKNLQIHALPKVGELIRTRVTEEHHVMGASVVSGEMRTGKRLLARCEMKVFLQ